MAQRATRALTVFRVLRVQRDTKALTEKQAARVLTVFRVLRAQRDTKALTEKQVTKEYKDFLEQ